MAAKKKLKKTADAKVNYSHGNKLFEKLGVAKVRAFIEKNYTGTGRKFENKGGGKLLMNCLVPGHADNNPSFLVDCNAGFAKCFSCGYFTKNFLQLLQDTKDWSYSESITQLHGVAGFRIVPEKIEKELDDLDIHQTAYKLLFRICNEHLRNCINPPDGNTDYAPAFIEAVQATLDWLYTTRKHDPSMAAFMPYGILPPTHMVTAAANAILEAEALKQAKDTRPGDPISLTRERREKLMAKLESLFKMVDGQWVHSVCWFNGGTLSQPGRMRLRKPREEKKEGILALPGFTEEEPIGWFGLYLTDYSMFRIEDIEKFIVLVVEGENDALSIREMLMQHGITGVLVIASCGNMNEITDTLALSGIRKVYMLGDEPSPERGKGDEWIRQRLLTASDVDARPFVRWTELMGDQHQIKDPDDVIHTHPWEHFHKLVLQDLATSNVTNDTWAFDKALAAGQEIEETEILQRQEVAAAYGECVRHPALLASYIRRICEALGITEGPLRCAIVQSGKNVNSEEAFIARIAATIKHEFHICYKEDNGRGGTLFLYHREKRRPIEFYMTDGNAMLASFSNIFSDVYLYFKNVIGLPPTYGDENVEELSHTAQIRERQKDLGEYLKIAMQTVYQDVPAKSECIIVGQGVHLLPDLEKNGEKILFVLNGKRAYLGRWTKPGIAYLSWEELNGPTYGRYLFSFQEKPWSLELDSVDDLNWGNAVTLPQIKACISDVNMLFENCFRFTHHKLDAKFLAYHLFSSVVHTAFPSKVILAFLGPSHSGKSTAMSVFDGGQYKHLQLQEAALNQASYSMAGVYMTWNHSALGMGLQEFESDELNTQKGQAVENINVNVLRQITADDGAPISRGTVDGTARTYELHTNVFLSSITRARHPQDENRRFTVEMQHIEGMKDPTTAIYEFVSQVRYAEIRRIATLGLLKHIQELASHHTAVYNEMNRQPLTTSNVPTRFLRNFTPLSSVMTLLGEDWKPFVIELCDSRKDSIASVEKDNPASNIFARVTKTPSIQIGQHGRACLTAMLGKEELWKLINTSNSGAFYDDEKKLVILDWVAATSPGGLLHRVDDVRGAYRNLKYSLDQHPTALKGRDYAAYGVYNFLRASGMVAGENEISVLRINDLVAQIRSSVQETSPIAVLAGEAANDKSGNGNV